MSRLRVLTVVGARPQFIKAAALSRAFKRLADVEEILVHTGQHYDKEMSDVFFSELEIEPPRHNLHVGSGKHGQQTGRMLMAIEETLLAEKPDVTLVYGDTNSTLAGALAAAKLRIPIAHVEAGLRSFNFDMPEEINRRLTDHCSDLLFAPTYVAVDNLKREGIPERKIYQTGDVMYDVSIFAAEKSQNASSIVKQLNLESGKYALATVHRAENTDNESRLHSIVEFLTAVSREMKVVFPVHPRTRAAFDRTGLAGASDNLLLVPPAGYLDMVQLEKHARIILTDSGGVQKEAYFYDVPCVTLRDETEWVELVESGWNSLAKPGNPAQMLQVFRNALNRGKGLPVKLYGSGNAAEEIAKTLLSITGSKP